MSTGSASINLILSSDKAIGFFFLFCFIGGIFLFFGVFGGFVNRFFLNIFFFLVFIEVASAMFFL
jgi:hypothetical protein